MVVKMLNVITYISHKVSRLLKMKEVNLVLLI